MLDTKDNQEQLPATSQTQQITPQLPCNIILVLLSKLLSAKIVDILFYQ